MSKTEPKTIKTKLVCIGRRWAFDKVVTDYLTLDDDGKANKCVAVTFYEGAKRMGCGSIYEMEMSEGARHGKPQLLGEYENPPEEWFLNDAAAMAIKKTHSLSKGKKFDIGGQTMNQLQKSVRKMRKQERDAIIGLVIAHISK